MVQARSTVSSRVATRVGVRNGVAAAMVVLGTLLLAACAQTPPRPSGDPVAVELGPTIRLLDAPTSRELVHALIDDAGLAHVVIASPKGMALRHVVVDPTGGISLDEVVRPNVSPASLDAAFDAAGQLHILADAQHFVRESSGQWSEAATPWAAAGLDAVAPRFVAGGDRNRPLVFAFDVRGKALGAPARWDIYGLRGYGAGIIWPWRTRGSRLAVVAEDGGRYGAWSVVDLDDNEDVADWQVVAEPDGHVHVVYDTERNMLATLSQARYACIEPTATDDSSPARNIAGHRLRAVSGSVVPITPEAPTIGLDAALGFNTATRELLLVRQHVGGRVLRDGGWGPDVPFPLDLAWEPRVAPRAARRFDVVVTGTRTDSPSGHERPVFYLQFRDGRWSAPVEVAGAKVEPLFGWVWDAVQLASDGHERVLVTWPVPDGIEARWLSLPAD
jgi:hypothetical protein